MALGSVTPRIDQALIDGVDWPRRKSDDSASSDADDPAVSHRLAGTATWIVVSRGIAHLSLFSDSGEQSAGSNARNQLRCAGAQEVDSSNACLATAPHPMREQLIPSRTHPHLRQPKWAARDRIPGGHSRHHRRADGRHTPLATPAEDRCGWASFCPNGTVAGSRQQQAG
jgi:hypothetical protein